ncbi:MAG: glycosyltransferase family 39 protein [Planctomycetes bacterium]|nr:glycosyltransferase family 39 protein [Planctomycetota bacterium]
MVETDTIRLRRLTGIVLLAAAVIRAALVLQPACIDRNGVQLIEFSRRMETNLSEAMRVTTRQPGYSLLLLWTHRTIGTLVGGDTPEAWQRCGELIAMIGGIGVCLAIVLLTRKLFDEHTALAAAVLVAIWPQGAHLSAGVLSDMPHLALYLFALLLVYSAILHRSPMRLAFGGALIGMAYLFKQEAISLFIASIICWWISMKSAGGPRRIGGMLIMTGCFALVIAPHSLATDKWLPNKNPLDLLKLLGGAGDSSPGILAYVLPWWKTPGRFLEECLRSGRYVFAILFLVGALVRHARKSQNQGKFLLLTCATVYVILLQIRAMVYGEISERYAAIPAVLMIPWAASGWLALMELARSRLQNTPHAVRFSVIRFLLLLIPLPAAVYLARPVYAGKNHYREAGIQLRQMAQPDDRILAHEHLEQIMFYAGRTFPSNLWVKGRRSDTQSRILRLIRGKKPAWYVDAQDSHRGQLSEIAHFEWLASQSSQFEKPVTYGPQGRHVHVYRVVSKSPRSPQRSATGPARP